MLNTSRIQTRVKILMALAWLMTCLLAYGQGSNTAIDITAPGESEAKSISSIKDNAGNLYVLTYSKKLSTISIKTKTQNILIEKLQHGHDPSLIGETNRIRFLPMHLQPYMSSGKILFTTVKRTNGGNGNGQCGSGAEVYLRVLSTKPLGIVNSILIESCSEGIELDSEESGNDKLSAFSTKKQQLYIDFLSYKDLSGDLSSTLSNDFKFLNFYNQK